MNERRKESIKRRYWGRRPWTRHSLVLVVAGWSFVALGVSIRFYTPGGPRWESLIVARNFMPLGGWSIVFILAGVAVMASAVWPRTSRMWGYMLLTGLSAGWAMIYLFGMFILPYNDLDHFSAFLIWALQAFVWWAISGLSDTARVHHGQS